MSAQGVDDVTGNALPLPVADHLHFRCSARKLRDAAQEVSRAITSQSADPMLRTTLQPAIPIRDNILIRKWMGAKVTLQGNDTYLAIETDIYGTSILSSGAITVPAKMLIRLLGALGDAEIDVEADATNGVVIRSMGARHRLLGLPAGDYPPLPAPEHSPRFDVRARVLHDAIRKTLFAVSHEPARPKLTGVQLTVADGHLQMVATDTHRLAKYRAPVERAEGDISAIVPARALIEVSRVLRGINYFVTVRVAGAHAQFELLDEPRVTTRLIAEKYPDYDRVIPPDEGASRLEFDRAEMLGAMRRCSFVARGDGNRVRLDTRGDVLNLEAESALSGRGEEMLPVVHTGEKIPIAFNAQLMIDALSAMDSERVAVITTEPTRPALLRPVGSDGQANGADYLCVLMPMHRPEG